MHRRSLLKGFGLGIGATAAPIAAAVVAVAEPRRPPKQQPFALSLHSQADRVEMSVGEDGHLWIKPNGSGEWKRVKTD